MVSKTSHTTSDEKTDLGPRLEAVLMAADRPMSDGRLAEVLQLIRAEDDEDNDKGPSLSSLIKEAIEGLNAAYKETGRSFCICKLAGGWQVLTNPEFTEDLTRLKGARQQAKLSPAAIETLAIIAYKQPILRADLESIRGVACGEVLRGLMDRRLVKIAGRAEEVGRPMLYGTTKEFLQIFGLATVNDLPKTNTNP